MDAFGMRSTPLEWLNEAIATVNEALTDARFDEVDNGAGWREVTVKELEIMLNMRRFPPLPSDWSMTDNEFRFFLQRKGK